MDTNLTAFNTWTTRFDEAAKRYPDLKDLSVKNRMITDSQVLGRMLEAGAFDTATAASEMLRMGEEYLWLLAGKPYYNVHPKMVGQDLQSLFDYLVKKGL
jgi:hypothetical protein